ncbi:signal recognition particle subunit SRP19 [Methanomicrobium sp. W14]|uniref:signal recognition particle subunit SRP19/SEC65 family protein n=1 Tax=Methanomicrobium sp. W14 TaxID=2817839 RepID=UPI001AE8B20E|nr:signal recognition particle subunit SRP19/SEC65 family protein [Methanomicrobium sp. W14]MBP2133088.1 signal recognition particle subunit SRP19 [Methanomicrobium sp. W14]
MKSERILYPCYFNESLSRADGRRVSKSCAVKNPTAKAVAVAAEKLGLKASVEQKSHPSRWLLKEGRVVVGWEKSKEILIKNIAVKMKQ